MADIVLCTLNATYQHCAFGLRYLRSNLGELNPRSAIREFTINHQPRDVAESLLADQPRIIGLGVYIWNTTQTRAVIEAVKTASPGTLVVLGGPEVSFELEEQAIVRLADVTIKGEADLLFADLCRRYLETGERPTTRLITGPLPDLKRIALPYEEYTDEDIRHRVLYVEASRGCPFKCEFCLSSLDESVRAFDLEVFLASIDRLIARGARQFKFIDRTFNLSVSFCTRILEFFLERVALGLFLHFEMIPDRLPKELRALIRSFPAGSVQFEIGIQTWNPEVAARISRKQNYDRIRENFAFLRAETSAHLHADLIVGLPGEDLESFGRGFDAVAALDPHEIQVGLLKRLKGTPIVRHDEKSAMRYQSEPPFTVLQTSSLSYTEVQELARFAKFWDLYANSGNFKRTMDCLRELASQRTPPSLFAEFRQFARFLDGKHPQRYGISLAKLVESAWEYLTAVRGADQNAVRQSLATDYSLGGKRRLPRPIGDLPPSPEASFSRVNPLNQRQRRHLDTALH